MNKLPETATSEIMLVTWSRCINWTVLLSALLAVLFALILEGCARL